jgi:hypothetical protein
MNIEFLILVKNSHKKGTREKKKKEGNQGRKEKNRGDKPTRVIVHIYIEISQ